MALVVCFLFQDFAFAATEIISLVSQPSLPSFAASAGRVEESYRAPGSSKTLYLIQDAHTNEQAQLNISKIIDTLDVTDVLLEGGSGDDSLTFLRKYADVSDRGRVARSFLKKGYVQGPDYLDLTTDKPLRLWGVEDKALYRQSLDAYRRVRDGQEHAAAYLAKLDRVIRTLKGSILNPPLSAFDAARQDYLSGRTKITDYFSILIKEAESQSIPRQEFPELSRYRELKAMEEAIDFNKAAEEERAAIQALDPSDREMLGKSGDVSEAHVATSVSGVEDAFFSALSEKIKNKTNYPELSKYLAYRECARALRADKVLSESDKLENSVYAGLIRNEDERFLIDAAQAAERLRRVVNLRARSEDLLAMDRDSESHDVVHIGGFLNKKIMESQTRYEDAVFLDEAFDRTLAAGREFYRLTNRRDEVFVRGLSYRLAETGQSRAALVAGGYHSENLKRLLKARGFSYVSIIPQTLEETNIKKYEGLLLDRHVQSGAISDAHIAVLPARQMRVPVPGNSSRAAVRSLLTRELVRGARLVEKRPSDLDEAFRAAADPAMQKVEPSSAPVKKLYLRSLDTTILAEAVAELKRNLGPFDAGVIELRYDELFDIEWFLVNEALLKAFLALSQDETVQAVLLPRQSDLDRVQPFAEPLKQRGIILLPFSDDPFAGVPTAGARLAGKPGRVKLSWLPGDASESIQARHARLIEEVVAAGSIARYERQRGISESTVKNYLQNHPTTRNTIAERLQEFPEWFPGERADSPETRIERFLNDVAHHTTLNEYATTHGINVSRVYAFMKKRPDLHRRAADLMFPSWIPGIGKSREERLHDLAEAVHKAGSVKAFARDHSIPIDKVENYLGSHPEIKAALKERIDNLDGRAVLAKLRTAGPDVKWKDYAEDVERLAGLSFGVTNKVGSYDMTPRESFPTDWHALGVLEAGWSGTVVASSLQDGKPRFTVEFKKEGEKPRKRSFVVGMTLEPADGVGKAKGQTTLYWSVESMDLAARRLLGRIVSEESLPKMRLLAKELKLFEGEIIAVSDSNGDVSVLLPAGGFDRWGTGLPYQEVRLDKVRIDSDGMVRFAATLQPLRGRGQSAQRVYEIGSIRETTFATARSIQTARSDADRFMAWLVTRPAAVNWSSHSKRLQEFMKLSFPRTTNALGQWPFRPKTNFEFKFPILGMSEAGWQPKPFSIQVTPEGNLRLEFLLTKFAEQSIVRAFEFVGRRRLDAQPPVKGTMQIWEPKSLSGSEWRERSPYREDATLAQRLDSGVWPIRLADPSNRFGRAWAVGLKNGGVRLRLDDRSEEALWPRPLVEQTFALAFDDPSSPALPLHADGIKKMLNHVIASFSRDIESRSLSSDLYLMMRERWMKHLSPQGRRVVEENVYRLDLYSQPEAALMHAIAVLFGEWKMKQKSMRDDNMNRLVELVLFYGRLSSLRDPKYRVMLSVGSLFAWAFSGYYLAAYPGIRGVHEAVNRMLVAATSFQEPHGRQALAAILWEIAGRLNRYKTREDEDLLDPDDLVVMAEILKLASDQLGIDENSTDATPNAAGLETEHRALLRAIDFAVLAAWPVVRPDRGVLKRHPAGVSVREWILKHPATIRLAMRLGQEVEIQSGYPVAGLSFRYFSDITHAYGLWAQSSDLPLDTFMLASADPKNLNAFFIFLAQLKKNLPPNGIDFDSAFGKKRRREVYDDLVKRFSSGARLAGDEDVYEAFLFGTDMPEIDDTYRGTEVSKARQEDLQAYAFFRSIYGMDPASILFAMNPVNGIALVATSRTKLQELLQRQTNTGPFVIGQVHSRSGRLTLYETDRGPIVGNAFVVFDMKWSDASIERAQDVKRILAKHMDDNTIFIASPPAPQFAIKPSTSDRGESLDGARLADSSGETDGADLLNQARESMGRAGLAAKIGKYELAVRILNGWLKDSLVFFNYVERAQASGPLEAAERFDAEAVQSMFKGILDPAVSEIFYQATALMANYLDAQARSAGDSEERSRLFEMSTVLWGSLVTLRPKNEEAIVQLATVLYHQDRFAEAETLLGPIVARADAPRAALNTMSYIALGRAHVLYKEFREALRNSRFSRALAIKERASVLLYGDAKTYLRRLTQSYERLARKTDSPKQVSRAYAGLAAIEILMTRFEQKIAVVTNKDLRRQDSIAAAVNHSVKSVYYGREAVNTASDESSLEHSLRIYVEAVGTLAATLNFSGKQNIGPEKVGEFIFNINQPHLRIDAPANEKARKSWTRVQLFRNRLMARMQYFDNAREILKAEIPRLAENDYPDVDGFKEALSAQVLHNKAFGENGNASKLFDVLWKELKVETQDLSILKWSLALDASQRSAATVAAYAQEDMAGITPNADTRYLTAEYVRSRFRRPLYRALSLELQDSDIDTQISLPAAETDRRPYSRQDALHFRVEDNQRLSGLEPTFLIALEWQTEDHPLRMERLRNLKAPLKSDVEKFVTDSSVLTGSDPSKAMVGQDASKRLADLTVLRRGPDGRNGYLSRLREFEQRLRNETSDITSKIQSGIDEVKRLRKSTDALQAHFGFEWLAATDQTLASFEQALGGLLVDTNEQYLSKKIFDDILRQARRTFDETKFLSGNEESFRPLNDKLRALSSAISSAGKISPESLERYQNQLALIRERYETAVLMGEFSEKSFDLAREADLMTGNLRAFLESAALVAGLDSGLAAYQNVPYSRSEVETLVLESLKEASASLQREMEAEVVENVTASVEKGLAMLESGKKGAAIRTDLEKRVADAEEHLKKNSAFAPDQDAAAGKIISQAREEMRRFDSETFDSAASYLEAGRVLSARIMPLVDEAIIVSERLSRRRRASLALEIQKLASVVLDGKRWLTEKVLADIESKPSGYTQTIELFDKTAKQLEKTAEMVAAGDFSKEIADKLLFEFEKHFTGLIRFLTDVMQEDYATLNLTILRQLIEVVKNHPRHRLLAGLQIGVEPVFDRLIPKGIRFNIRKNRQSEVHQRVLKQAIDEGLLDELAAIVLAEYGDPYKRWADYDGSGIGPYPYDRVLPIVSYSVIVYLYLWENSYGFAVPDAGLLMKALLPVTQEQIVLIYEDKTPIRGQNKKEREQLRHATGNIHYHYPADAGPDFARMPVTDRLKPRFALEMKILERILENLGLQGNGALDAKQKDFVRQFGDTRILRDETAEFKPLEGARLAVRRLIHEIAALAAVSASSMAAADGDWLWKNAIVTKSGSVAASSGQKNGVSVDAVKIDLRDKNLKISLPIRFNGALKLGDLIRGYQETLATAQSGSQVLAAVNGGFFDTRSGVPIGFVLSDGDMKVFNIPKQSRSLIGFVQPTQTSPGKVLFASPKERLKYWLELHSPGKKEDLLVYGVNVPRGRDAIIVYTPAYGATTATNPYGTEILFKRRGEGFAVDAIRTAAGNSPIPTDGFVLSLHGKAMKYAELFKAGDLTVNRRYNLPDSWVKQNVTSGLAAGPRVTLVNGRYVSTEKSEGLSGGGMESSERVLVGLDAGGKLVFETLKKNRGNLSFIEAARVTGITDGVFLDGGSSRSYIGMNRRYSGRRITGAVAVEQKTGGARLARTDTRLKGFARRGELSLAEFQSTRQRYENAEHEISDELRARVRLRMQAAAEIFTRWGEIPEGAIQDALKLFEDNRFKIYSITSVRKSGTDYLEVYFDAEKRALFIDQAILASLESATSTKGDSAKLDVMVFKELMFPAKKIALIGASGFIGDALYKILDVVYADVVPVSFVKNPMYETLDAGDEEAVRRFVEAHRPEVIIYAAGVADPAKAELSKDKAYDLNVEAVRRFQKVFDGVFIYFSSTYVLDETNALNFTDSKRNPRNYYGQTKAEGETQVLARPGGTVLRLSVVFGRTHSDRNFVDKIVKSLDAGQVFRGEDQQVLYPVSFKDLQALVLLSLSERWSGIMQLNGEEAVTRYDWARLAAKIYYHVYPTRVSVGKMAAEMADSMIQVYVNPPNDTLVRPSGLKMFNTNYDPNSLTEEIFEAVLRLSKHKPFVTRRAVDSQGRFRFEQYTVQLKSGLGLEGRHVTLVSRADKTWQGGFSVFYRGRWIGSFDETVDQVVGSDIVSVHKANPFNGHQGARLALIPNLKEPLLIFFAGVARAQTIHREGRLPLTLERRTHIFTVTTRGREVVAQAEGMEPIVVDTKPAAVEAALTPEQAPLSLQDIRTMDDSLSLKVTNLLGEAPLDRIPVIADIDLDWIGNRSFEFYLDALLAELVSQKRRDERVYFRFSGEASKIERAMGDPRAAGLLAPDYLKDARLVTLNAADKPGRIGTANVPVYRLEEGDIPAFDDLLQIAVYAARMDASNIPDGFLSAYQTVAGTKLGSDILRSILSGLADPATRERYALKPLVRVDINQAVRYFQMRRRNIDRSA